MPEKNRNVRRRLWAVALAVGLAGAVRAGGLGKKLREPPDWHVGDSWKFVVIAYNTKDALPGMLEGVEPTADQLFSIRPKVESVHFLKAMIVESFHAVGLDWWHVRIAGMNPKTEKGTCDWWFTKDSGVGWYNPRKLVRKGDGLYCTILDEEGPRRMYPEVSLGNVSIGECPSGYYRWPLPVLPWREDTRFLPDEPPPDFPKIRRKRLSDGRLILEVGGQQGKAKTHPKGFHVYSDRMVQIYGKGQERKWWSDLYAVSDGRLVVEIHRIDPKALPGAPRKPIRLESAPVGKIYHPEPPLDSPRTCRMVVIRHDIRIERERLEEARLKGEPWPDILEEDCMSTGFPKDLVDAFAVRVSVVKPKKNPAFINWYEMDSLDDRWREIPGTKCRNVVAIQDQRGGKLCRVAAVRLHLKPTAPPVPPDSKSATVVGSLLSNLRLPTAMELLSIYGEEWRVGSVSVVDHGYAVLAKTPILPLQAIPWKRPEHINFTRCGLGFKYSRKSLGNESWREWALVSLNGEKLFQVQQRWRDGDAWWLEYRAYVFGLLSLEAYRIQDGLVYATRPEKPVPR